MNRALSIDTPRSKNSWLPELPDVYLTCRDGVYYVHLHPLNRSRPAIIALHGIHSADDAARAVDSLRPALTHLEELLSESPTFRA